jgi:hypothetical protein
VESLTLGKHLVRPELLANELLLERPALPSAEAGGWTHFDGERAQVACGSSGQRANRAKAVVAWGMMRDAHCLPEVPWLDPFASQRVHTRAQTTPPQTTPHPDTVAPKVVILPLTSYDTVSSASLLAAPAPPPLPTQL